MVRCGFCKNNLIWLTTRKRNGGMEERDALPMTEQLRKALLRHRFKCGHQEYVFVNPNTGKPYRERNHWLPSLCKKAGVKPFNYHSIRHLVASWLDKHNVPLTTIQKILRHKDPMTTAKYLHELTGVKITLDRIFDPKILKFENKNNISSISDFHSSQNFKQNKSYKSLKIKDGQCRI